MSWPQYAREKDQAAEIFRQQTNAANLTKELPKVEWSKRTAVLRRTLETLYAKYREALRLGATTVLLITSAVASSLGSGKGFS